MFWANGHQTAYHSWARLLVVVIVLLAATIVGALLSSGDFLHAALSVEAQGPTMPSAPRAATLEPPPENMTMQEAVQISNSAGRQVFIGFDNLPYDIQYDSYWDYVPLSYALSPNQYPDVIFSSTAGYHVATYGRYYGHTPLPTITRANNLNNYSNHFAPLIVDFPRPVSDFVFVLIGGDSIGPIADIEIYQNGVHTQNAKVFANGYFPVTQYGASSYKDVTKIIITRIVDPNGIGFDNFNFTVQDAPSPTPTPTPAPSPTPPPTPTNLTTKPDEQEIRVFWTPSQGAGWYVVNRSESQSSFQESSAQSESSALVPINPTFHCNTNPCVYTDDNSGIGLDSDLDYTYQIAAVNSAGTSPNSAPVTDRPLKSPCSQDTITAPVPGTRTGHGWALNYEFSGRDGLIIRSVYLNNKLMANQMSVPYFLISTMKGGNRFPNNRGELTKVPNSNSPTSRLIKYSLEPADSRKLTVSATYAIERIPGTPRACMLVTQKYEFYKAGEGPEDQPPGNCEPSGLVRDCQRFRPMIHYTFSDSQGGALESFNIPMRLHFQNTTGIGNTLALTRDRNWREFLPPTLSPFKLSTNPVEQAWHGRVIVPKYLSPNKDNGSFDNIHQTNARGYVDLPGLKVYWKPLVSPLPIVYPQPVGCPECIHLHWRWADYFRGAVFNRGNPIIPPFSDQTVDLQIVRYRGNNDNDHPQDYYGSIFINGEPIRNPDRRARQPYDVVFWYSPTGFQSEDKFFWHTAWFSPQKLSAQNAVSVLSETSQAASSPSTQDGPLSVTFGSVYEEGTTNFLNYDLSTLPSLPPGYQALNNTAYFISTTAVVGGPHIVTFGAPSITDQNDFDNLRVFYAEPDPFDPEKPMWMESTILSPDSPTHDFSNKTLSARTDGLGVFVIARLAQPVPPNPDVANLRVSCSDSADPVTADTNLTYTTTVTNDGPQAATGVMVKNPLSPDVRLVSANPSQGTCKQLDGTVYCSLNSLASGTSATVTLVVKPSEGTDSFPTEGKLVSNTVLVRANEGDTDAANDWVSEGTTVLPSPNRPPVVSMSSPSSGAVFVGPATVTLNAIATDSDGGIASVQFFDNDELIGSGAAGAGNNFSITKTFSPCDVDDHHGTSHPVEDHHHSPCYVHTLVAVATDNLGRQNVSAPIDVLINGSASVTVTSPQPNALINPGSNVQLTASASSPSGISKVEFFANGTLLGQGSSLTWNNVGVGNYSIVAVVTDNVGVMTTSEPVKIMVDSPPTVTVTSPTNGAVFPSATNINVSATAESPQGAIARVDFYANGVLIASASDVGSNVFTATWRNLPDGIHSLTAVATDNLGLSTTSAPITIGVNTPSPREGEFVWFDDAMPPGAVTPAGQEGWYWVDANPGAFSGAKSHQSRNFGQVESPNSFHRHYFEGAPTTFPVNAGDKLFTYVFLDVNNMPRKITLEWKDANGWEHRAYWQGHSQFIFYDGTNSKPGNYLVGPLPKPGKWVRLEVPAGAVGLEGAMLNGMSFALEGGRATFDLAGKVTANAPPPPTTPPGDSVWFDDSLPSDAITAVVDDNWNWVTNLAYSGQRSHQTRFDGGADKQFRSHSFTGAQTPMQINPGDVLFTYVYLGNLETTWAPYNAPDQIMIQWYDGTSWEHRAFWGVNFIGTQIANTGVQGTEGQRYMGGLPPVRGWYRLEVPASYVGLEGKSVSGMAFSTYRKDSNPFVAWDRSGKSAAPTAVPRNLSATSGVWRSYSSTHGYAFEMHDVPPPEHLLERIGFYVHPNQAAGTVPMHRFRRPGNYEYFYTTNQSGPGSDWQYLGVAFYVYPDGTTPGTVPLHLYHDLQHKYVLTTDYNEAIRFGMGNYDAVWGYVYGTNPQIPFPPTGADLGGCSLSWRDNSATEVGFKIEELANGTWNQIATTSANIRHFCVGGASCNEPGLCMSTASYRVRAYNSFGDSQYSNIAPDQLQDSAAESDEPQPSESSSNAPPTAEITSLPNSSTTERSFAINANSFDLQGNGTIVKVEFFVDGSSLGEIWDAPYIFVWNNVTPGTYTLTAVATDSDGAATTSEPVTLNVAKFDQAITFEQIPDKTFGDAPFSVNASASSGLPVTFAVVSGPATASGNSVTITGAGIVTVRASQSGDTNYNAADVDVSFNVAKASAAISLSNLNQTFDGSAKSATAATTPAGLSGVSITYNGSATAPTNAGSYAVVASITNSNYSAPDATGTLTIAKASATISLSNLSHIYDGTAKNAIVSTNPAGLSGVTITYNGSATLPTNAGSYAVAASLTNSDYSAPDATGTLTIAKASATISLSNLSHVYDGTAKNAFASTNPAGLGGVTITYNGSSTPPTNAGSYSVVASLTNSNYSAIDATGTLTVAKASATISLSNLSHVYDGTTKNAIASTSPVGLGGVIITYNGSATLPTNAGSYAVVASLTNSNYSAPDATGTLSVAKASQTITFDQPPNRTYGDPPFTLNASSSSGLSVTFSIVSGPATISGNTVTLTGAWTVTVRASQGGDTNYNAAADVNRTFIVHPQPTDVVISQIYGGGGNSGSTYRNDYIELFNRGTTTVNLNGWTVQYASAIGTIWQITNLIGSLAPGHYYLIQQAQGAAGTALPAADATGSVAMNATSGKVALLNGTGCLNVNPNGWDCEWDNTRVIDLVGYGSEATTYEGDGPTVSASNTSSVVRGANGCIDLNDNRSDFDSGSPTPRNTIAAVSTCATANPSNSIVISEFRTRGPNGGNDEFIELYNKSNSAINIGGWKIKGSNNTASVSTRVTVAANTSIPAHGNFLVTNVATGGYSGTRVGDQTYTVGIVDNGGIAVTRADDTIVDQVGMSTGSTFKEGRVLTSFTINTDRSYERKPGGIAGSGQDTDDNRSDFLIRTPPDAQNSGVVPSPETGGVKIVHIDVGQGDATLIIGPSKSLLFDAGPTGSGAQIRSILNSNNLTSVDYFVAGHYHEDHIGGIDELVNSGVPINVASYDRAGAYSSQAFDQYVNAVGTKRTTIDLGEEIDLGGGCVVTCIAVDGRTLHGGISPTDENARSIALVVRFGTFDYFIASDLTGGGLGTVNVESLIAPDAGDVDVMRVSHHGSQTSTNQSLIDTLHPEQAVISVGDGNSYGHPTQAVLDRLSAATNINTIWQTELGAGGTSSKVRVGGNIVFLTNGFAYSVSTSVDTQTYGFPTDGIAGISSVGPRGFLSGQYFAAVRWPVLLNGNQSTNVLAQLLGYDRNLCCQAYRH